MPRWSSPLTAAAVTLSGFLLVYAVVVFSGNAPSHLHAIGVAACGGVGALVGWAWVIFKRRRERAED